jgi:hypothetical protein
MPVEAPGSKPAAVPFTPPQKVIFEPGCQAAWVGIEVTALSWAVEASPILSISFINRTFSLISLLSSFFVFVLPETFKERLLCHDFL